MLIERDHFHKANKPVTQVYIHDNRLTCAERPTYGHPHMGDPHMETHIWTPTHGDPHKNDCFNHSTLAHLPHQLQTQPVYCCTSSHSNEAGGNIIQRNGKVPHCLNEACNICNTGRRWRKYSALNQIGLVENDVFEYLFLDTAIKL